MLVSILSEVATEDGTVISELSKVESPLVGDVSVLVVIDQVPGPWATDRRWALRACEHHVVQAQK